MTKHTLPIEGLPEGWEPVAYRRPKNYERFLLDGEIKTAFADMAQEFLVIQKTKTRRIVLEETEEERSVSYCDWYEDDVGRVRHLLNNGYGSNCCFKIWREIVDDTSTDKGEQL